MLTKSEAYTIIDRILEYGKGYDLLVNIHCTGEGLTRFANSGIHQNVYKEDVAVSIKVQDGPRSVTVNTNRTDESSIRAAVKEAAENLKLVPPGDTAVPLVGAPAEISSEDYDRELAQKFSTAARAKLIKEGIAVLGAGYHAAGALALITGFYAVGNSLGIKRFCRTDHAEFNVMVMETNGSSGYAEIHTDRSAELDVAAGFHTAYTKAQMGVDPIDLEPGHYTVILEPLAVGDLLNYMAYAGLRGRAVQQEISFLTGKTGQKVFGDNITIRDNCRHPAMPKLPFDFEGAPRKEITFFDRGTARELAYDLKTALKDGKETTGHSLADPDLGGFPCHLVMEGGEESMENLIAGTANGLLVTRFHYMNIVNPREIILTALTRDGLFLIENGGIARGVRNLRFTESLLNAFNNIAGITARREKVPGFFGVSYVPALKIENFAFTGKTS